MMKMRRVHIPVMAAAIPIFAVSLAAGNLLHVPRALASRTETPDGGQGGEEPTKGDPETYDNGTPGQFETDSGVTQVSLGARLATPGNETQGFGSSGTSNGGLSRDVKTSDIHIWNVQASGGAAGTDNSLAAGATSGAAAGGSSAARGGAWPLGSLLQWLKAQFFLLLQGAR